MSFPKILHRACQARHLSVRSTGRLTEGKKSSEEAGLARPFVDQMNLLDIISFRSAHAALISYLLGLDYLIIRLKMLGRSAKILQQAGAIQVATNINHRYCSGSTIA